MTSSTDASRLGRVRPGRAPRTAPAPRPASAWPARSAARWSPRAPGSARAISAVVRPPSRRRVSATRARRDSTGWQAVNTSRSRSSLMSRPRRPASSPAGDPVSRSAAQLAVLALERSGCAGTGRRPGAWPRSSARPPGAREPLGRPLLQRGDQRVLGQLLGQPEVAGVPGQPGDQPGRLQPDDGLHRRAGPGLILGHSYPSDQALRPAAFAAGQLTAAAATGCAAGPGPGRAAAGTLVSDHLPDPALARADDGQEPLGPLDGLVLVAALHQRPAADELLGLGERAVKDGEVAAVVDDLTVWARLDDPAGGQEHTSLGGLLHELAHLLVQLGARLRKRRSRVAQRVTKESHVCLLCFAPAATLAAGPVSPVRRTARPQIDSDRKLSHDLFWPTAAMITEDFRPPAVHNPPGSREAGSRAAPRLGPCGATRMRAAGMRTGNGFPGPCGATSGCWVRSLVMSSGSPAGLICWRTSSGCGAPLSRPGSRRPGPAPRRRSPRWSRAGRWSGPRLWRTRSRSTST